MAELNFTFVRKFVFNVIKYAWLGTSTQKGLIGYFIEYEHPTEL